MVLAVGVMLFGVWSVLRIQSGLWASQGRRRSNWVLLMMLFGPLAVLLFYGTVRQYLLNPERFEVVDGVSPADR